MNETEEWQSRSCYINFAGHLLNRFSPNMLYPELSYRWKNKDWRAFLSMISDFGFNTFEFWLVPKLFCRKGLSSASGLEFSNQMSEIIRYAREKNLKVKMACSLATVGEKWHTFCPNVKEEWDECLYLWDSWTKRLSNLDIVGIFPGDPGACSRNGCTAETFIDKAIEVSGVIKQNIPDAMVELGTWGNPFFGWGCIKGPEGWKGEFVQSYQHTAWTFDRKRSDNAMNHLLKRLKDFPAETTIAINLAFNPDGDPDADNGQADARPWANEIAKTNRIVTWDFSLTEGENTVIPHYRFDRLFEQRKRELTAAPYNGGICFTMTPLLNQLSLYMAAQSFLYPATTDYGKFVCDFYGNLFGPEASELVELLPLFEIIPGWGNYNIIDLSREEYHRQMKRGVELLEDIRNNINTNAPFFPSPETYLENLLFFFRLFTGLSGTAPDFDHYRKQYWDEVYGIYDSLPEHVDPRPKNAVNNLIKTFSKTLAEDAEPIAGRWV